MQAGPQSPVFLRVDGLLMIVRVTSSWKKAWREQLCEISQCEKQTKIQVNYSYFRLVHINETEDASRFIHGIQCVIEKECTCGGAGSSSYRRVSRNSELKAFVVAA